MADLVLIALHYMHIVFGVAWIGAAFYGYIVLRTGMGRVPMPVRRGRCASSSRSSFDTCPSRRS